MPKLPDGPPSYDESMGSRSYSTASSVNNLTTARAALVTTLIAIHVKPHLDSTAQSGLSSTSLILVPANMSTLHPTPSSTQDTTATFPGEKIVGLPSNENPAITRLREPEYSLEFLRQPTVLQKIKEQLCLHLNGQGYRKIAVGSEHVWSPSGLRIAASGEADAADAVLGVSMTDVCLRVESAMGLYETRNGKCLVIKAGMED